MRDAITKLLILLDFMRDQYSYWRKEIWKKDLDAQYCCNGRECGCMGATNREVYRPAQGEFPSE